MSVRRRLLLALTVAAAFAYGYLTHRNRIFPYRLFAPLRSTARRVLPPAEPERPTPRSRAMEAVLSVPYLDGYVAAPRERNVTKHDRTAAFAGLNLYTTGGVPGALLVDMDGTVLHRWTYPSAEAFPHKRPGSNPNAWRRAHLFENGDVLGIFEGMGCIKLDQQSRLLWAYPGGCHHDLFVTEDGTIYALTRTAAVLPRIDPVKRVWEDFITILDRDGRALRRVSLLRAFERSPYSALLARMTLRPDLLHTNTIEVLDGSFANRGDVFRRGNVLVSSRRLDAIAIVDLEKEQVVWAMDGMWRAQHQPTFVAGGNILIFDNLGVPGRSKVFEFDPLTQKIAWEYGRKPGQEFFSEYSGSCQRLPNGNTLITESNQGRAFEVTPSHETVWEFFNPNRVGDRNEKIATLFEMVRYPPDYAAQWLRGEGPPHPALSPADGGEGIHE
jgi:hypothetical protein